MPAYPYRVLFDGQLAWGSARHDSPPTMACGVMGEQA